MNLLLMDLPLEMIQKYNPMNGFGVQKIQPGETQ